MNGKEARGCLDVPSREHGKRKLGRRVGSHDRQRILVFGKGRWFPRPCPVAADPFGRTLRGSRHCGDFKFGVVLVKYKMNRLSLSSGRSSQWLRQSEDVLAVRTSGLCSRECCVLIWPSRPSHSRCLLDPHNSLIQASFQSSRFEDGTFAHPYFSCYY
jgi:hypothetical protein